MERLRYSDLLASTTQSDPDARRRARAATLGVFAAYLLLAIALTYPLIEQIATAVPNDPGDPLLNTWILWWNARTVPFSTAWWNAPAFYPAEGVLALSEPLLGISPISSPIYWLSGNAQLAYNVVFLLTFPLSAVAAYVLCLELTGRRDASFIGGLVFGFAPYRIAHFPHIQILASFWMPLALLGLHRFLKDGRIRWLALFGAAWLLQALSNLYYAVYFSVLVLLWVCWFLPGRRLRDAVMIAGTWALAAVPLVPLLLRYRSVHETFAFTGRFGWHDFGADIASLLDAAPLLTFWGFVRVYHRPEGELFPGIAGVFLVAVAILMSRSRSWPLPSWLKRVRWLLMVLALGFAVVGIVTAIKPWRASIAGVMISSRHADKPLFFTFMALLGLLATNGAVIAAFRRRSVFAFYVLAAVVMWLLCLGPVATALGFSVVSNAPYAWLLAIPGMNSLRVPPRFAMMGILCLSAAAALAFNRIAPVTGNRRLVLTGALSLVAIADGWITEMPLRQRPRVWASHDLQEPGAVMELPLGDTYRDVAAMYRTISHGRPVVNGFSGYFPPSKEFLQHALERRDPHLLLQLSALGVKYVVIDSTGDGDGTWGRYVASQNGVERVRSDGTFAVYRLPDAPPISTSVRSGVPVAIASIEANVNSSELRALTDGDLVSRWQTGPQKSTHSLTIDLGKSRPVTAVILSLGPYSLDYPRELAIELSHDGVDWLKAWHGGGAGPAFLAAVRRPRDLPLTFELGNRSARFIRVRQLAEDPFYYWSVAELAVLAPGP